MKLYACNFIVAFFLVALPITGFAQGTGPRVSPNNNEEDEAAMQVADDTNIGSGPRLLPNGTQSSATTLVNGPDNPVYVRLEGDAARAIGQSKMVEPKVIVQKQYYTDSKESAARTAEDEKLAARLVVLEEEKAKRLKDGTSSDDPTIKAIDAKINEVRSALDARVTNLENSEKDRQQRENAASGWFTGDFWAAFLVGLVIVALILGAIFLATRSNGNDRGGSNVTQTVILGGTGSENFELCREDGRTVIRPKDGASALMEGRVAKLEKDVALIGTDLNSAVGLVKKVDEKVDKNEKAVKSRHDEVMAEFRKLSGTPVPPAPVSTASSVTPPVPPAPPLTAVDPGLVVPKPPAPPARPKTPTTPATPSGPRVMVSKRDSLRIDSISMSQGSFAGGYKAILKGFFPEHNAKGKLIDYEVFFGRGWASPEVTWIDERTLECIVPRHPSGVVSVSVQEVDSKRPAVKLLKCFTYFDPSDPSTFPGAVGASTPSPATVVPAAPPLSSIPDPFAADPATVASVPAPSMVPDAGLTVPFVPAVPDPATVATVVVPVPAPAAVVTPDPVPAPSVSDPTAPATTPTT